jgi:hypothetical protein
MFLKTKEMTQKMKHKIMDQLSTLIDLLKNKKDMKIT